MDFFLDTGPIYGWSATNDKSHHQDCATLFRMYPVNLHEYYTTKSIVKEELKNLRTKRLSGVDQLVRLFERRCREILSKINDADYTRHPEYHPLSQKILEYLDQIKKDVNPKDRDAALLANAFLWDKETAELYLPTFLTLDQHDIGNNQMEIKNIAEGVLKRKSALQIVLVREIVRTR